MPIIEVELGQQAQTQEPTWLQALQTGVQTGTRVYQAREAHKQSRRDKRAGRRRRPAPVTGPAPQQGIPTWIKQVAVIGAAGAVILVGLRMRRKRRKR